MDSTDQCSEPKEGGSGDRLHAQISRNGVSETVGQNITCASIGDLIGHLKELKEHTNEILTKFVLEDTEKGDVRKAGNNADDDEESDEPEETASTATKRHKA